ncbi:MAG: hypothetical protein Q8O25_02990 [Sulfurisoma sp.]|nr:hypothetical protein [Sulfurisoma sp.]
MTTVPQLTILANLYGSDKGSQHHCAHRYTDAYEQLFSTLHNKPLRLLEIGLMHGRTQHDYAGKFDQVGCPSLRMWAEYFPRAQIFGLDIVDFRALAEDRITIGIANQGDRASLEGYAVATGGQFDIIIDDGSHASHHQQITLGVLFQHLSPGGLYCIEDLHYQPADMELPGITPTRAFLRGLTEARRGNRLPLLQSELGHLIDQVEFLRFFDSQSNQWPKESLADALAVLRKKPAGVGSGQS